MCVRTVITNDANETLPSNKLSIDESLAMPKYTKSLTRAKEKYMKIYDEMLAKDSAEKAGKDVGEGEIENKEEESKNEDDLAYPNVADRLLGLSTKKYGILADYVVQCYENFRRSDICRIIFSTTQPAHIITIAAVLCVSSALVPNSEKKASGPAPSHSQAASFVYLASFVMHFGAQIWMTFISGLSLYFALPRHTFGEVQRVLFPRYFTINACLSLTTLLIYVKHHPVHTWDSEIAIQVGAMSGAFFLELLIRLYLTPKLLSLMLLKISIERAAGVGNEIGRQNPGTLKHCPHYLKIHEAFRRVHVGIAIGNIITMACTVLHLHYLAGRLCVL